MDMSSFAEYVDFVQRAFPEFTNEIEEVISEGDKAFARLTFRGTHRGEVFGIAPTGRTDSICRCGSLLVPR
jgi:predicted ester cyclase